MYNVVNSITLFFPLGCHIFSRSKKIILFIKFNHWKNKLKFYIIWLLLIMQINNTDQSETKFDFHYFFNNQFISCLT